MTQYNRKKNIVGNRLSCDCKHCVSFSVWRWAKFPTSHQWQYGGATTQNLCGCCFTALIHHTSSDHSRSRRRLWWQGELEASVSDGQPASNDRPDICEQMVRLDWILISVSVPEPLWSYLLATAPEASAIILSVVPPCPRVPLNL